MPTLGYQQRALYSAQTAPIPDPILIPEIRELMLYWIWYDTLLEIAYLTNIIHNWKQK